MRVVREVSHPQCKITIYAWNNRYLIKFEQGMLEQTFKIHEYDVVSEDDLFKIIDEEFVQQTLRTFNTMEQSLHDALNKLDP